MDHTISATAVRFSGADAPTLSVNVWGRQSPPCVFVHGFGEGAFTWNDFAERLAPECQIVAPDLRGHGDSDWDPSCRYDVRNHVDDVCRVMEALGLQEFLLVGHSMGGDIAVRIASENDRVRALVIVEYGPQLDSDATSHIRREFDLENRVYESIAQYVDQIGSKQPLMHPRTLEHTATNMLKPMSSGGFIHKRDPALAKEIASKCNADVERQWERLRRIKCPALIVRGLRSSVLGRNVAQRMAATLRDGTLNTVAMAGHAVMRENPEGFAGATLPFIRSHLRTIASGQNT